MLPTFPAHAQRFNPKTAAPSLGAWPSADGTYTINTSDTKILSSGNGKWKPTGSLPPTISGPNGYVKLGTVRNGCALFAWDGVIIGSKQHIVAKGARPLVLLSQSYVAVDKGGTIDVSGDSGGSAFAGDKKAPYSAKGGLGGPGGGDGGNGSALTAGGAFSSVVSGVGPGRSDSDPVTSGGAGFGGQGGSGQEGKLFIAPGGAAYGGSLSTLLQGGSGAGGTLYAGGGGGGGALEISTATFIVILGTGASDYPAVSARGGNGNSGNNFKEEFSGSGGGSGGAIYLAAPSVLLTSKNNDDLSAVGGDKGFDPDGPPVNGGMLCGGAGGGGRIRIESGNNKPSTSTTSAWVRAGLAPTPPLGVTPPAKYVALPGEVVYAPLSPAFP